MRWLVSIVRPSPSLADDALWVWIFGRSRWDERRGAKKGKGRSPWGTTGLPFEPAWVCGLSKPWVCGKGFDEAAWEAAGVLAELRSDGGARLEPGAG